MIIDEKQDFVLTGKKETDHNIIFLKTAADSKVLNKEKLKIWKKMKKLIGKQENVIK